MILVTACRKRRIKCDEGRPICANCIKSKRACEGYNPRVVFKEPLSADQGPFQSSGYGGNHASDVGNVHPQFTRTGVRPSLTPIAPRPVVQHGQPIPRGVGMSEDVFFSRQPGMSELPQQQFDFNTYDGTEVMEPQPLLPNPLLGLGHGQGSASSLTRQSTTMQTGWQEEFDPSYNAGIQQASSSSRHYPATYDEDDEDAMSISDDELIDPSDSRGLQSLSKAWNGTRVDAQKFRSFASSGALFTYMDSPANSELRHHGEIIVFSYFLNITSPTISMYERHPCDPIEKQEFHAKGHNLWSCKYLDAGFKHRHVTPN